MSLFRRRVRPAEPAPVAAEPQPETLSTRSARRLLRRALGARLAEVGAAPLPGNRIGWVLPDGADGEVAAGVWLQVEAWSRAFAYDGPSAEVAAAVRCEMGTGTLGEYMYERVLSGSGTRTVLQVVDLATRTRLTTHAWDVSFARIYGDHARERADGWLCRRVEGDDAFFPLSAPGDVEVWVETVAPFVIEYLVSGSGRHTDA